MQRMGSRIYTFLAALMLTLLVSEAKANLSTNTDRVVAIVSGSVITQQELDNRFELTKRQINQAIPKNQKDAIYRKILNDLINEEVQRQYAASNNIAVEDSEVDLAIAEIEKRNGWTSGAFYTISKGVEDSAKARIRSSLVRQKIIDRRLRSRVNISKGEIDRLIENINNSKNVEKKIHQVFISFDKKEQEKQAKKDIYKIYNELKSSKEGFTEFAENYNADSSLNESVDELGWFGTGELMAALDKALESLDKGDMSQPILSTNGWHILYVEDVRQPEAFSTEPVAEYELYKVSFKLNPKENKDNQVEAFENFVADFETLGDAEEAVLKNQDDASYSKSGSIGWVKEHNLPQSIKTEISDLDINDFTDIQEKDGYLEVYHLGNKRDVLPQKLQEYRNRIYNRLMSNRLELAARRFMRDLRRQAYIEVRL